MRRLLIAIFAAAALPVLAQTAKPANLQPLPEPPPPPPGVDLSVDEPQVTITKRGDDKVEEYRVNGKLYMTKVTPSHGVPYYLVDEKGDGSWARQQPTDSGIRVPMWVIKSF
jgi:hypothetical protein